MTVMVLPTSSTADIQISANEARRQCNIWLMLEITMGFIATLPDLHLDEMGRPVWRVPIMFSPMGIVDQVGYVDVDVSTGDILSDEDDIERWFERADKLAETLPPLKLGTMPPEYKTVERLNVSALEPVA